MLNIVFATLEIIEIRHPVGHHLDALLDELSTVIPALAGVPSRFTNRRYGAGR